MSDVKNGLTVAINMIKLPFHKRYLSYLLHFSLPNTQYNLSFLSYTYVIDNNSFGFMLNVLYIYNAFTYIPIQQMLQLKM